MPDGRLCYIDGMIQDTVCRALLHVTSMSAIQTLIAYTAAAGASLAPTTTIHVTFRPTGDALHCRLGAPPNIQYWTN